MKLLMNEKQAAALLSLQPATLRQWRLLGKGPAFYRVGGAIRYERQALEDFLILGKESPDNIPKC